MQLKGQLTVKAKENVKREVAERPTWTGLSQRHQIALMSSDVSQKTMYERKIVHPNILIKISFEYF